MKTAKLMIKGTEMEFSFPEMQELEDQINEAQEDFFKQFGDSTTFAQLAEKRKWADIVKVFGESETFMDFLKED